MIKSHGKYLPQQNKFEFISLRNEEMQFIYNHLSFELKDHNYSQINPGFISRSLVDKDFQHTINSLHFLIQGSATLSFEGQDIELNAGDVFMIGNHVKCSWEYSQESVEITLLFNLYLGNLNDLFTNLSKPLVLRNCMEDVLKMQQLFQNEGYLSIFEMKNMCMEYTVKFLEMSQIDLSDHIGLVKKYEKVFRYITEHLSMNLRLNEIAEQTNYSIGFFTKTFAKDNKITVKQYIHDKLMSQIEQLLIYTDLSLKEISNQFDFCELSYFTRWFKRYKGCTPTEYKKTLRQLIRE